ncbi:hypothetical protein [Salibacterium lacus]|uniref:Uncharacterized protein n=1 Tax=Salibacterium lacus TaxID=1898109 RepID=A0ABW5SWT7_9BACI
MRYDIEHNGEWVPHVKIMEDEQQFAMAPVNDIEGGTEMDYTSVKVYAKEAPEYPLQAVQSFVKEG